ncbi:MAG: hypothetical protein AB1797_14025, partial [bacterium]
MLRHKVNIIWFSLILGLSLFSKAENVQGEKHVLVAYDISQSMRGHWDKKEIIRLNGYLAEFLFDGLGEINPQDQVISSKETPFLARNIPLLSPGDRLSLVKFGGPPIPPPELSEIYDGTPSLRTEVTSHLPNRMDELKEDWTCLDLLHWKASQIFQEYPELKPYL